MIAINGETMLTGAPIMAIVPTTDLARAKAFYGETLGLVDADVPTPGRQVIYQCGNSATGSLREAWFRDPDGNILRIHSHVAT
jgi:catechol 2,3-dioxygenase-like lactoylglutathione lyase family enzyme